MQPIASQSVFLSGANIGDTRYEREGLIVSAGRTQGRGPVCSQRQREPVLFLRSLFGFSCELPNDFLNFSKFYTCGTFLHSI